MVQIMTNSTTLSAPANASATPSASFFRRFRRHGNGGVFFLPHHHFSKTANNPRGRRTRRKCSFALFSVVIATICVLQWAILSSLLAPDASSNPENRSGPENQLLWTSCPSHDGLRESDQKRPETNGRDKDKDKDNFNDNFNENENENEDICFVTCIFGGNVRDVDQPANVEWFRDHWCHTRFLLVTNLPDLPAPGWTKIVSPIAGTDAHADADADAESTTSRNTTRSTAGGSTSTSTSASAIVNAEPEATTKLHIVQSRHAKFLAWDVLKDIAPKHCATVMYMDGYLIPKRYTSWRTFGASLLGSSPWSPSSPLFGWVPSVVGRHRHRHLPQIPPPPKFQAIVKQVRTHPWGLSQVKQKYFDGLSMTTLLHNLVRDRKDTEEHVRDTLEWFRSHTTDFQEIMPYYLNKYFAYDPNNARYRELSSYFWKTYTTYGGLWRDQPLWAYVLHHFNVTPAVMTTEGTITKGGDLFETGGTLGWGKHVYV